MKVLKICVVVLFMIISFTTIVNASQEDNHSNLTPSILPELDMSGLNKDIELIEVDPEIMNATPEWIVLVHDDVGKSSWIEDIDRSELSPEEKNTIKNSLINLWNTYPVKTVDGGEKTIELTSQTDGSNEIVTVPIGHVTYIQFDREKIIQAALNKNSIQATKLQTLSSLSVISLSEAENQTIKNLTKLRSKLYKKEQGSQRQNLSQYYSSQSVTPKISFPASDSFSSGFSIPSSYSDDSIYPLAFHQ